MPRSYFIFVLLLTVYSASAQPFEVTRDTLIVDLRSIVRPTSQFNLSHALKYQEKYFCFLEEWDRYEIGRQTRRLLVIDSNGGLLHIAEPPYDISSPAYFDFFIRDKRLLLKTYMDHKCFRLAPKRLRWKRIKEVDDCVYKDRDYIIMYLNFGEWGQSTWFIDRKSGTQYILGINGTTVNRHEGSSVFTTAHTIWGVKDPKDLQLCADSNRYRKQERRNRRDGSSSLKGIDTIYHDSSFDWWNQELSNLQIHTSFASQGNLYHLYSDSNGTAVGAVKDRELAPVQYLNRRYHVRREQYSYRGENRCNDYRFLQFDDGYNRNGFLEINRDTIKIHHLLLKADSLTYVGLDGFSSLIKATGSNRKLYFSQVAALESRARGIDRRNDRQGIDHNGYYPKYPNPKRLAANEFIKVLDATITQTTEYLYDKRSGRVKSIFVEWAETKPLVESKSRAFWEDPEPLCDSCFQAKQNELISVITTELDAMPKRTDGSDGLFTLNWQRRDGLEITLYAGRSGAIRVLLNIAR